MLQTYLEGVLQVSKQGDAREESYYSILESLLKQYADSFKKENVHITILPKKTEAGNPDFRVWDGKQHITGYIEAKSPSVKYLDLIETTDQLQRYLHIFPNLILTNFTEFRLYRKGILIDKVIVAMPDIILKFKTAPPAQNEEDFFMLLEKFFSFSLPKVYDARGLAVELAKRTRFLKDEIVTQELKEEEKLEKGIILGFYNSFKKYLISNLTQEDFADFYSQTVTYGLFAARTKSGDDFNRKLAYDNIPKTIGILKDVFQFISLGELPQQMEWIIDDISEVLAVTDVRKILHEYFHEGKGKDPVVHFYETFLAEYAPSLREKRGVYYTPEPVVQYIIQSLHKILMEYFDRQDGFASDTVTVLDPAAGTLTFLAEASKLATEQFVSKFGEAGKQNLIGEHILRNFYAFELMMAPYAIGHLKISFLLEELGYKMAKDDRFKLYLTNTLEMEELQQTELPGMASLSEESHLAGKIKKERPILVILGNPPYSGHSANLSEKYIIERKNNKQVKKKVKTWIGKLVEDYKYIDNKPLDEKNPKWLQDDYVKFIRFAQWKIGQTGEGVLGFITNHSYLDNPTFRGMRQSLMRSFNEIYILDLHGNSLKKEKCPDGSKDENVFDIQQGVAISLFIKKKGEKKKCKVSHSEIWGLRDYKYDWLLENNIKTVDWTKISPKSEFYLFIPRDEKLLGQYEEYPKVTQIFPLNSVGIVTARDDFVIDFDKEELKRRIRIFRDEKMPDELVRQTYNLKDKSNWKLKLAREKIRKDKDWEDSIARVLYRPFDIRWIFYNDDLVERPRRNVMQHIMQENLGLITVRQVAEGIFNHAFVTDSIVESRITLSNKGIGFLFPLYIYEEKGNPKKHSLSNMIMLLEPEAEYEVKKSNLSPAIVKKLEKNFQRIPSPEQIFYYIYAVLYSNSYRTKYAGFLKMDFPRIPFTSDYTLFGNMGKFGEKLADLHMLKSSELDPPVAKFQGQGDNRVTKTDYEHYRIYINDGQYFEGMEPEVWKYQIGGYQVCDKWLKGRLRKKLILDDVKHYCRIITSLQKTIRIQRDIDIIFSEIEKKTISFDDK